MKKTYHILHQWYQVYGGNEKGYLKIDDMCLDRSAAWSSEHIALPARWLAHPYYNEDQERPGGGYCQWFLLYGGLGLYNEKIRFKIPLLGPSSWRAAGGEVLDHESPCPGPPEVCMVLPLGVVTVIKLASNASVVHSIRYPTGRKVLNPWMREGWPLKRVETRSMTPGVSILEQKVGARLVWDKLIEYWLFVLELFHDI